MKKSIIVIVCLLLFISCENTLNNLAENNLDNTTKDQDTNDQDTNDQDTVNFPVTISISDNNIGTWSGSGDLSTTVNSDLNQLEIDIITAGSNSYEPKAFINLPILSMSKSYTLTFNAYSAIPRNVNFKVGTQLSSDPYWAPLYESEASTINLTSTATEYAITFDTDSIPAHLNLEEVDFVIEVGSINGDNSQTSVYIYDPVIDETELTVTNPPTGEMATNPDDYTVSNEWTLIWEDDFNDGVFDTNTWTRQVMMSPHNQEWQQYTGASDTAWEADGAMIIKAEMTGTVHGAGNYESARVISNPGGQNGDSGTDGKTFKYGKIAARIQLPKGKGLWPAFWMLGDNISETGGDTGWPQCGEIDILESGSVNYPDYGQGTITGALHHDPSIDNSGDWQSNLVLDSAHYTLPNSELFSEAFHVFEIEWDENSIVWKVDGIQAGEQSISESGRSEFHENFYVIFNIAVSGWYTVPPDDTTPFPAYMYIDWIRHYTK